MPNQKFSNTAPDDEGRYPVKVVWSNGLVEFRYMSEIEICRDLTAESEQGIPYFRVLSVV